MSQPSKSVTDEAPFDLLPYIGEKRARLLRSHGLISLGDIGRAKPETIREILGNSISLENAVQIIEAAQKLSGKGDKSKPYSLLFRSFLKKMAAAVLFLAAVISGYEAYRNIRGTDYTIFVSFFAEADANYSAIADSLVVLDDKYMQSANIGYDAGSNVKNNCIQIPFSVKHNVGGVLDEVTIAFTVTYPAGTQQGLELTMCGDNMNIKDVLGMGRISRKATTGTDKIIVSYNIKDIPSKYWTYFSFAVPAVPNTSVTTEGTKIHISAAPIRINTHLVWKQSSDELNELSVYVYDVCDMPELYVLSELNQLSINSKIIRERSILERWKAFFSQFAGVAKGMGFRNASEKLFKLGPRQVEYSTILYKALGVYPSEKVAFGMSPEREKRSFSVSSLNFWYLLGGDGPSDPSFDIGDTTAYVGKVRQKANQESYYGYKDSGCAGFKGVASKAQ